MIFTDRLKLLTHNYVRDCYRLSRLFPRDELYGITSQLRRASMSVMLNLIEGYARRKGQNCKVYKNFLEISYGSLKETKYLLFFAKEEKYINNNDYQKTLKQSEEIAKMLWTLIKSTK